MIAEELEVIVGKCPKLLEECFRNNVHFSEAFRSFGKCLISGFQSSLSLAYKNDLLAIVNER